MRYYSITIGTADGRQVYVPTGLGWGVTGTPAPPPGNNSGPVPAGMSEVVVTGRNLSAPAPFTFSSHPNGPANPPDPGALDVELDMVVYPGHIPQGGSIITVHGTGLKTLGQAISLDGAYLTVSAGMGVGLPLATAAYQRGVSGLLFQGEVFQAFGNWEGTQQSLSLVVYPGGLEPDGGICFAWGAKQPLDQALMATFKQAFPDYKYDISIIPGFLPPQGVPVPHMGQTLEDFASALQEFTEEPGQQVTGNPSYQGVWIWVDNGTVYADDFQKPPAKPPTNLVFEDFIGQPTWIDANTIQFSTIMRADIGMGDRVYLPSVLNMPYVLTTASAALPNAPARSVLAFTGQFVITEVHHFGHFRQADAGSWTTAFTAASAPSGGPPASTKTPSTSPST